MLFVEYLQNVLHPSPNQSNDSTSMMSFAKKRADVLALLALLSITFSACDTTGLEDALEDFNVVVELPPIDVYSSLLFVDAATGEIITDEITVTFDGVEAENIIDYTSKPTTQFKTRNGSIAFGLRTENAPSAENPIGVNFHVSGNNYLPLKSIIPLTDSVSTLEIELASTLDLPSNLKNNTLNTPTNAIGGIEDSLDFQFDYGLEEALGITFSEGSQFSDGDGNIYTGNISVDVQMKNRLLGGEDALGSLPTSVNINDTLVTHLATYTIDATGTSKIRASAKTRMMSKPTLRFSFLTYYIYLDNTGSPYIYSDFGDELLWKASYISNTGERKFLKRLNKKNLLARGTRTSAGSGDFYNYVWKTSITFEWPEDLIAKTDIYLESYVHGEEQLSQNCLYSNTPVSSDKYYEVRFISPITGTVMYKLVSVYNYLRPREDNIFGGAFAFFFEGWTGDLSDFMKASRYIPAGKYILQHIGGEIPFNACDDFSQPIILNDEQPNKVEVSVIVSCSIPGQKPTVNSIPLSRVYYKRPDYNQWFSSKVSYGYDPLTQTLRGGSFKINNASIEDADTYMFRYYYGDDLFTGDIVVDSPQITINETIDSKYCQ